MQAIGRLGLGGLVIVLAACGATRVHPLGDVNDGGRESAGSGGSGGSGASAGGGLGGMSGGVGGIALGGSEYGGPAGTGSGVSGCGSPPEPSCAECQHLAEANDVRGFAATAASVYWIEHGTQNDLDELNDDGRVMAVTLGSHKGVALVTALPAPVGLGISALYAYVFLENHGAPVLRRYPLDRGEPEDVAAYPKSQQFVSEQPAFAATDKYAYFQLGNELHRIPEQKGSKEELVATFTEPMLGIAGDETYGYFRTLAGVYRVDAPGATPFLIAELPVAHAVDGATGMPYDDPLVTSLRLSGDRFYGVELGGDKNYLGGLPKVGGSWKRVARLDGLYDAQALNDGFFGTAYGIAEYDLSIVHGSFAAPTEHSNLATFPRGGVCNGRPPFQPPWVPTTEGVYWATQTNVYFTKTL